MTFLSTVPPPFHENNQSDPFVLRCRSLYICPSQCLVAFCVVKGRIFLFFFSILVRMVD